MPRATRATRRKPEPEENKEQNIPKNVQVTENNNNNRRSQGNNRRSQSNKSNSNNNSNNNNANNTTSNMSLMNFTNRNAKRNQRLEEKNLRRSVMSYTLSDLNRNLRSRIGHTKYLESLKASKQRLEKNKRILVEQNLAKNKRFDVLKVAQYIPGSNGFMILDKYLKDIKNGQLRSLELVNSLLEEQLTIHAEQLIQLRLMKRNVGDENTNSELFKMYMETQLKSNNTELKINELKQKQRVLQRKITQSMSQNDLLELLQTIRYVGKIRTARKTSAINNQMKNLNRRYSQYISEMFSGSTFTSHVNYKNRLKATPYKVVYNSYKGKYIEAPPKPIPTHSKGKSKR